MPKNVRPDLKTRIFTIIVIVTNVLGDTLLKWGLQREAIGLSYEPLMYIQAIFRPYVLLGVSLLILWMLSRMALLSWADLSYVLPVTSIGYVLITLVGKFVFSEEVSPARWIGTIFIIVGMILVGTTPHSTTVPSTPPANSTSSPKEVR